MGILRTKKGGGGGGERGKTYMVATHTHKHMEKWASLKKKRRGKTGEYVHGSHGASCPHKKRIQTLRTRQTFRIPCVTPGKYVKCRMCVDVEKVHLRFFASFFFQGCFMPIFKTCQWLDECVQIYMYIHIYSQIYVRCVCVKNIMYFYAKIYVYVYFCKK